MRYKGFTSMNNKWSNHSIKARIITGISFGLGLLFDYFFYDKMPPGISFPLYILMIIVGLLVLAKLLRKQLKKEVLLILGLAIFFSMMVFIRASILLTFFNIFASLLLLLIVVQISFSEMSTKRFSIENYLKIFLLPFKFIHPLWQTLSDLFSFGETKREVLIFFQIMRGVLIAIPVLFVFLFLFSSADLIFHQYITSLLNIDQGAEIILRLVLILIITLIFTGAYTYTFRDQKSEAIIAQSNKKYIFGYVESFILFGGVNILFLIFIFIQLTYLFGGENNISIQGFTYAEYARRGFFELMVVVIISLILLLVIEKYITKKEDKYIRIFKFLSITLIIQAILIDYSAFTRLYLYEKAYGFTILRFYSQALIILLAVIFCLLLYKIYKNLNEHKFVLYLFILLVLFWAGMNFLNPDAFIARRNIERFEVTGKLDTDCLIHLSEDAIPVTIELLNITNQEFGKNYFQELYWITKNRNSSYFSKWQSLNISRLRANKILDLKVLELEP